MLFENIIFQNYSEINSIYNTDFDEKEFTEFEQKLFNSNKKLELNKYNLNDKEILNSLSNYYKIMNNNTEYLKCLLKLMQINDARGIFNLATYYYENDNIDKAIFYYQLGSDNNDACSKYCLANIFENDITKEREYLKEAVELDFIPAIYRLACSFAKTQDIINMNKYIDLGIKAECQNCLDLLELEFLNCNKFYNYLIKLPYTNELIKNKIVKLKKIIKLKK